MRTNTLTAATIAPRKLAPVWVAIGQWMAAAVLAIALCAVATDALAQRSAAVTTPLDASAARPASAGYRLQPGDTVEISVWGEEELQRQLLVRPDGTLSFPLTGEVRAAGRTVTDVQNEVTQKLVRYIAEPTVTVSVTGLEGNRVYVIGQVNNPGTFVMNPTLTVLQALALAGGTTAFASLNDIVIIRDTDDGQRALPFAYDDIKRGRRLEQNVQLRSGDTVLVP
jgi:polysaccharide export outer membrane protein